MIFPPFFGEIVEILIHRFCGGAGHDGLPSVDC